MRESRPIFVAKKMIQPSALNKLNEGEQMLSFVLEHRLHHGVNTRESAQLVIHPLNLKNTPRTTF